MLAHNHSNHKIYCFKLKLKLKLEFLKGKKLPVYEYLTYQLCISNARHTAVNGNIRYNENRCASRNSPKTNHTN